MLQRSNSFKRKVAQRARKDSATVPGGVVSSRITRHTSRRFRGSSTFWKNLQPSTCCEELDGPSARIAPENCA